jgi:quercetin dioxygenase-like cupin family protein
MAIHHAHSGELIDVRPLRAALAGEITKALYKSDHLEVIRMVLPAGKSMPAHRVAGEVTVQCLEGAVEVVMNGARQLIREGEMVCLAGGVEHALDAVQDSSLLVTILLHGS